MKCEDVQESVRHGCDDLEPAGAPVPGGVRDGGGKAGVGGDRAPIQDPRGAGQRQQGPIGALVPPEEDLQGRPPHRRRHRRPHRRRPRPLPLHAIRVHQLQIHLRISPPCRPPRCSAR